jgi:hypothetical protein
MSPPPTGSPPVPAPAPLSDPAAERRAALIGGAVFAVSGASLVVHILTGAPLWALLAALVVGGCVAVVRWVWSLPEARTEWMAKVRVGVVVGLIATGTYDLSRWLLVQVAGFHLSPFKALPFFGEALLGGMGDTAARTVVGIGFHLLNGITFGIAYAVWFGRRSPWWGVPFALGLEAFMLALYPGWLDVRSIQELTQVSVFGHLVYGLTLGFGTSWALRRFAPATERTP